MGLPSLEERGRGWIRYLERKLALDDDDWSSSGVPAAAWDNMSGVPTNNWYRFDAIGMAITVVLATRSGTLDLVGGVDALDGVCDRLRLYHGFNEWVEQKGPDPQRADYPRGWRGLLIPGEVWGSYDTPGWASNGAQGVGFESNPIDAQGAIYYKGFFNFVLGLRALLDPQRDPTQPIDIVYDDELRFRYSHSEINTIVTEDFSSALEGRPQGLCCEIHKLWPL